MAAATDAQAWQPSATIEKLRLRAELFASVRRFFAQGGVLEVDVPALSRFATVDRHIDSFAAGRAVAPGSRGAAGDGRWLHTSPEFGMKRLLAAGSGPIYQLSHVFRVDEAGRQHNPEFTLLEWYRPGWDAGRLMDEVADLLQALGAPGGVYPRVTYRDAFRDTVGVDPYAAVEALQRAARDRGLAPERGLAPGEVADADFWRDLLAGTLMYPRLGQGTPCFVHDFPASQAALARIRPGEPPVAERFELVWQGVELANGFHELTDAAEQAARFAADRAWRGANDRVAPPHDAALVAALEAGLPQSSGVALGLDRLLMLLTGAGSIDEVLPFAWDRA